ncbi:signal peptide containing protein [Theileria equi strain WA]|uniref:Signal peptide containing protein n=1 Tax=Theileria equi strain WA TaxID=1537102 RepID=L1LE29_THEEQ|nr:signal peptide containing protein [Theileria equi strain WA]EKX73505.1 signal peptide containing protein [Theileria equi strain WA]|eukprot:XP_004832957.1 signal peptide containing protein [Theileria equi strain WA]
MKILSLLYMAFLVGLCKFVDSRESDGLISTCNEDISGCQSSLSFSLDLAELDETRVTIQEYVEKGVKRVSLTPKENVLVSSVVDAGATLWEPKEDKECKFLTLVSKDDLTLLAIDVVKCGNFEFICFEKEPNGKWSEVTREAFEGKVNKIL